MAGVASGSLDMHNTNLKICVSFEDNVSMCACIYVVLKGPSFVLSHLNYTRTLTHIPLQTHRLSHTHKHSFSLSLF